MAETGETRVNKIVREYIRRALVQKVNEQCPHYPQSLKDEVVANSMDGLHVSRDVLYRAIGLAMEDQNKRVEETTISLDRAIDVINKEINWCKANPEPGSAMFIKGLEQAKSLIVAMAWEEAKDE